MRLMSLTTGQSVEPTSQRVERGLPPSPRFHGRAGFACSPVGYSQKGHSGSASSGCSSSASRLAASSRSNGLAVSFDASRLSRAISLARCRSAAVVTISASDPVSGAIHRRKPQ